MSKGIKLYIVQGGYYLKKHCDTCRDSYYMKGCIGSAETVNRQHCKNSRYNSAEYTRKMLLEDWGKNYCRYWTPKNRKDAYYEKHTIYSRAQSHS